MSEGKYQILYKKKLYTARFEGVLLVGDMVDVCAPGNDWSKLFIISTTAKITYNSDEQCLYFSNFSTGNFKE